MHIRRGRAKNWSSRLFSDVLMSNYFISLDFHNILIELLISLKLSSSPNFRRFSSSPAYIYYIRDLFLCYESARIIALFLHCRAQHKTLSHSEVYQGCMLGKLNNSMDEASEVKI